MHLGSSPPPTPPRVRLRPEPFGAVVVVDDPPAVALVDRVLAERLGADPSGLWVGAAGVDDQDWTAPVEAHVALTDRCGVGCAGCYADSAPRGATVPTDAVVERLRALANLGVLRVAFGGGEPLTRRDLRALADAAHALGLEPTLMTSGTGLTDARVGELSGFTQVNVSLDGIAPTPASPRGAPPTGPGEEAISRLAAAGVAVGANVAVTRANFTRLEAILDRARELGASELQLLRYKPAGRARGDAYARLRLDAAQVDAFPAAVARLVALGALPIRIDCALVPLLSSATELRAEALVALGVWGCEAGRALGRVDTAGALGPCSFWSAEPGAPVTHAGWRTSPVLARLRAHAREAPEPCRSCAWRPACRGGCRVVAEHVVGDAWAPDPECPRVVAHARAHARTAPPPDTAHGQPGADLGRAARRQKSRTAAT